MTLLTSCRWIGDSRYKIGDIKHPDLLALLHPVLPLLLALHLAHLLHGGGGGGGLPPLHRAALALLTLPLQALSLLHNTGKCISIPLSSVHLLTCLWVSRCCMTCMCCCMLRCCSSCCCCCTTSQLLLSAVLRTSLRADHDTTLNTNILYQTNIFRIKNIFAVFRVHSPFCVWSFVWRSALYLGIGGVG